MAVKDIQSHLKLTYQYSMAKFHHSGTLLTISKYLSRAKNVGLNYTNK
jgi:hypothetical protein